MTKLDRRIIRTRQLLRDALMALILEKGYEAVTVGDITERANLGRATFYLHYKDKEELLVISLESLFDELVETLEPPLVDNKVNNAPILATFRHAEENKDLYRVLLNGEGSAKIYRRCQAYIAQVALRRFFPLLPEQRPYPDDLLANYLAGSLLTLIAWWLDNDLPHSADYMAQAYHILKLEGLKNVMQLNITFPDEK